MPTISIISWNIENIGQNKNTAEIRELIARFVVRYQAQVLGIMEVRNNQGFALGQGIVNRLNAIQAVATWQFQESPQYVNGRLEQYVFVWRQDRYRVTAVNPAVGIRRWQYTDTFANPNPPPPVNLGFPRQIASDRPPFVLRGTLQGGVNPVLPIGAFHAPEPGFFNNVRDGCNNLAAIQVFQNAAQGLFMGDFNVSPSDINGWRGAAAFGPLGAINYTMRLVGNPAGAGVHTTLIGRNSGQPGMARGSYWYNQYDNFFFKASAQATFNNVDAIDLVDDTWTAPLPAPAPWLGPYVRAHDCRMQGIPANNNTYATVYDAFIGYRWYISDHVPVIIDINY